jgi:hypothetical protein
MQMSKLNKVGQLPPGDRWLLFQAVLLLPVVHIALLLLGYSRLRRVLEKLAPLRASQESVSEARRQSAREIARIVSIAAQHGFYKATCLRRSLLVWWLLRRQGIESQLDFGVRMVDGKLEAHAWVEYNGMVVNDSENVRQDFQTLYRGFPPTRQGL